MLPRATTLMLKQPDTAPDPGHQEARGVSRGAEPMRTRVTMNSGHTQGRQEPGEGVMGKESRMLGTRGLHLWAMEESALLLSPHVPARPGLLLGQDTHLAHQARPMCRHRHGRSAATTKLPFTLHREGAGRFTRAGVSAHSGSPLLPRLTSLPGPGRARSLL